MAAGDLTLGVVLVTALVDSINPCAIGVLLLLLGVLLKQAKNKMKMLKIATIYIVVVFIVYILSGIGLIWFQSFLIRAGFAKIVGTIVGALVIVGGLIEIKDFFWYGKGFSLMIPAKYSDKIKDKIEKISIGSAIFLGAFVAMVELPCTGGPYLAITTLLAKSFNSTAVMYLIIYNIIFVLPLVIIAALAYFGVKVAALKKWKKGSRKWMRLAAGIVMVLLGAFLIYYYQVGLHF
jgi:cytochrome c biogenesis protein CcdA